MLAYFLPLALIVISNTVYQICAKSVPQSMNPFASLTVTYAVGAVISLVLFFILGKGSLFAEYQKLNWAPVVLGIIVAGLEAGYIYAYKNGWQVGTLQIVQASIIAVALLLIGYFLYGEAFTFKKIIGVIICLIGLVFLNIK